MRKFLLHPSVIEIAAAIGFAVVTLFAVSSLRGLPFVYDEESGIRDFVLQSRADQPSRAAPPFLLVNVSQRDFARLGYPAVMPRDELAKLIMMAASGQPKLIIVDVDLAWPDNPAREARLGEALTALSQSGGPPVLLVRAPFGRNDGPPVSAEPMIAPDLLRVTPYDAVVSGSRNLRWVSALSTPDSDGVARRYRVAPRACLSGGTIVLPNVSLAACAALDGSRGVAELDQAIATQPQCSADGGPANAPEPSQSFRCAGYDWPIGAAEADSPIAYTMRWELPPGVERPQRQMPESDMLVEDVEVADALDLLDNAATVKPGRQFGGRAVIIGSSASTAGDTHLTSLGSMPGMMIIANAIRSGLEVGPRPPTRYWLNALVVAIMSVISWALWKAAHKLRGFKHFALKELSAGIITMLWVIVAILLLPAGQLIAFTLPQFVVTGFLTWREHWKARRSATAIRQGEVP